MYTFHSHSVELTQQLSRQLATLLQPGMVVALIGELGAGKTHLVQGIAAAMGVDPQDVNSPTYVLIQEYDAAIPLCHIDAYRLADVDEFLELGADELLGADNICLIEWADRVSEVLPKDHLTIRIETTTENSRRIEISGSGPKSAAVVSSLSNLET